MKLINPTDEELNAAFAESVARWSYNSHYNDWYLKDGDSIAWSGRKTPEWTKSADAVLPWLAKYVTETGCLWSITVRPDGLFLVNEGYQDESGPMLNGGHDADVEDKSLPRAAVIALLRAHGVEVEL